MHLDEILADLFVFRVSRYLSNEYVLFNGEHYILTTR
jgi:hypothetical protein